MELLLSLIKPLIEAYSGQFGVIVQILSILGSIRLLVKPLMALAEAFVLITPSAKDNEFIAKVAESKFYKTLVFILDWFGSIKVNSIIK